MPFTSQERAACDALIQLALLEDLGTKGDLTSLACIPAELPGEAALVARRSGILAGLPAAQASFAAVDPGIRFIENVSDGWPLQAGTLIAQVAGPMRSILSAERIALNFLQRLCGVATLTAQYVNELRGLPCKLLDTRKTTPGWRLLEKYAVRRGGGHNHRSGLQDGILIKDNHLAALGGGSDAIACAITRCREMFGSTYSIEIEVDTLEQLRVALQSAPDIILLDNMGLDLLRLAVQLRNELAPDVLLEASGGITLANLRSLAETGVDRISIGALTHSAVALDIGLDYLP